MKTKVAVILSGCGVHDGAEIQESLLTLLALEKAGAEVSCLAPVRWNLWWLRAWRSQTV